MAKTLEQLENKLRVKYIIKRKSYELYFGSQCIMINGGYTPNSFKTLEEAVEYGNRVRHIDYIYYDSEL